MSAALVTLDRLGKVLDSNHIVPNADCDQISLAMNISPIGHPRVKRRYVKPYNICTGTVNTGFDAVILVSTHVNYEVDGNPTMSMYQNLRAGIMLERYLSKHGAFSGYHVDNVHLVSPASKADLERSLRDPEVGSIALIGHSSRGSWEASDGSVSWIDVRQWVESAGHCKNGFGLKDGCNERYGVIYDGYQVDEYQVLAPAFGHLSHEGNLFIVRGEPPDYLSRGFGVSQNLYRLVPR